MLQPIEDFKQYNANGEKFLDFFNKNFNTNLNSDKGLIGGKVDKYIDEKLNSFTDKIGEKFKLFGISIFSDLLALVELGVIGYSMYQSIRLMFCGNRSSSDIKPTDKILLGYFIFFTLRVLNTIIKIRGGVYGR